MSIEFSPILGCYAVVYALIVFSWIALSPTRTGDDLKTLTKGVVLQALEAVRCDLIDLAVAWRKKVRGGYAIDDLLRSWYKSGIQVRMRPPGSHFQRLRRGKTNAKTVSKDCLNDAVVDAIIASK